MTFPSLSNDTWLGLIIGAILSAIVIPLVFYGIRRFRNWLMTSRPRNRILGPIAKNSEECTIFVRDFYYRRIFRF
jgi:hypothetical protein